MVPRIAEFVSTHFSHAFFLLILTLVSFRPITDWWCLLQLFVEIPSAFTAVALVRTLVIVPAPDTYTRPLAAVSVSASFGYFKFILIISYIPLHSVGRVQNDLEIPSKQLLFRHKVTKMPPQTSARRSKRTLHKYKQININKNNANIYTISSTCLPQSSGLLQLGAKIDPYQESSEK